jgi:hypothetical protein
MTEQRDEALRDLARAVAFPPTPDLRDAVVVALVARGSERRPASAVRRSLALALVATLVLAAAVAAAALVLPGLRIMLVPSVPPAASPTGPGAGLSLGDPITTDGAATSVPGLLGEPTATYSAHDGEVISLVWAAGDALPEIGDSDVGLILQEIRGSLDRERVEKLVVEVGASVLAVEVDGADGFWIEGPPHLVRYRGPGGEQRAELTRLVGDTLVWQRDGVLYRLESGIGFDRALRVAESMRSSGTDGS